MYILFGDPEGSPLKITIEILLCKVYGDDTAFLEEHVIISYLLWRSQTNIRIVNTINYPHNRSRITEADNGNGKFYHLSY